MTGMILAAALAVSAMARPDMVPPPERHVPFPRGPLSSVRIRLERSACFGTCPVYSVELRGDGTATYEGRAHVRVTGRHDFTVPLRSVARLVRQLRAADFWSLRPRYAARMTDLPTYRVSVWVAGESKSVEDYAGTAVGMPESVRQIENDIDRIAGDRWVRPERTDPRPRS